MTLARKILTSAIMSSCAALIVSCGAPASVDCGPEEISFGIHLVDRSSFSKAAMERAVSNGQTPPGTAYFPSDNGGLIVARNTEINAACLKSASAGLHPAAKTPIMNFAFNRSCANLFEALTSENIGKQFAVVINDKIITAPRIASAITGGSGFVEGGFTEAEAEALAEQLTCAANRK